MVQPVRGLKISRSGFDALRAHAEQAYPEECCGVLLGRREPGASVVAEVVRCRNTHSSPASRYAIDPAELVRLQRRARECGLQILGFYHSHPEHPGKPSPSDLAEAYWTGCSYVVIAVERGRATVTKSFLLIGTEDGKRFDEEQLIISES